MKYSFIILKKSDVKFKIQPDRSQVNFQISSNQVLLPIIVFFHRSDWLQKLQCHNAYLFKTIAVINDLCIRVLTDAVMVI